MVPLPLDLWSFCPGDVAIQADSTLREEPPVVPLEPDRRVSESERTRAAILSAAVHEFTLSGYDDARMERIAQLSGANKRIIYRHFDNKEALYVAVLERTYASLRSAEAELEIAGREPVEAVRELARFTWHYFLSHPELLTTLAMENQHKARNLKRMYHILELHSPLVGALADVLRRGANEGRFRSGVDPVRLYITIASLGFFYLSNRHTLSAIFRRELASPEELEAWGQHLVGVVLAYLRP